METIRNLFFRTRNLPWITAFCVLLCLAFTGCGSKDSATDAPGGWKHFTSKTGGFSALFPGTPNEKIVPVQTKLGEFEVHTFVVETDAETAFGVTYNDYPATTDLNPQKLFDGCQASVVGEDGKVVNQQEMKFQNYPAREFEFQEGGKASNSGKVRLILVGRRIYNMVAVYQTANPHPSERAKFFDGFSLNEK